MTVVGPAQHFQAQLCLLEATPIVFLESLNVLTISKLATRGLGSAGSAQAPAAVGSRPWAMPLPVGHVTSQGCSLLV